MRAFGARLARAGYPEIEAQSAEPDDAMRMHELAMMFQSTRGREVAVATLPINKM